MLIQEDLTVREKLKILSDAAKYDVACTSSGVSRKGKKGSMGSTSEGGICHSFSADGRCISLLKILFTNQCIHDCKYCINRCSNDVPRTSFTPEEVCRLTMEFYQRNYIEGLFLSSGILYHPNYTMDLIYQTIFKLRKEYLFNGYIHVKGIPGADPLLIEKLGFLVDRMSINLELPTAEGLRSLAPGKTREKILAPMRQIHHGIASQMDGNFLPGHQENKLLTALDKAVSAGPQKGSTGRADQAPMPLVLGRSRYGNFGIKNVSHRKQYFVPAGQSTQMIVGATGESDFHMIKVAEALYQGFGMKRVFYSAYVAVNEDRALPAVTTQPPLLREHRLYQADWLMRYYGFDADELLDEKQPNFNVFLDPKCDWALRHLEHFPVEVNKADYQTLLRVPGMGVKSVSRILAARKTSILTFDDLKKFGVVLKRAQYFITCAGKLQNPIKIDQDYITNCLLGEERRSNWDISHRDSYRQLSLFDDMHLSAVNSFTGGV